MPSTAQSAAYKTDKTPALGVDVPGGTSKAWEASLHSPATHPCPILGAPARHSLPHAVCPSSPSIIQSPVLLIMFLDTCHLLCNISPADICSHQPVSASRAGIWSSASFQLPLNEALHGPQGLNQGPHAHRVGNSGQILGSRNRSGTKHLMYPKFHSACLYINTLHHPYRGRFCHSKRENVDSLKVSHYIPNQKYHRGCDHRYCPKCSDPEQT